MRKLPCPRFRLWKYDAFSSTFKSANVTDQNTAQCQQGIKMKQHLDFNDINLDIASIEVNFSFSTKNNKFAVLCVACLKKYLIKGTDGFYLYRLSSLSKCKSCTSVSPVLK